MIALRLRFWNAGQAVCWAVAVLLGLAGGAQATNKPSRIASLNLCTDQLVLQLASPERIVSVTYLARDPAISGVAEKARDIPINHGLAEQILPLEPDLVLVGSFTTRPTTALLRRLGHRVEAIPPATGFDGVRKNIRKVGALLGEVDRADAMIRVLDEAFSGLAIAGDRPAAIVLRPRGMTTGKGSLVDEVLRAAGLRNLSAGMGVTGIGWLSLEQVIAAQPRLIIAAESEAGHPSLSHLMLRHPAYQAIQDHEGRPPQRVNLPAYLWNCGGPQLVEAVQRLSRARQRILNEAQHP